MENTMRDFQDSMAAGKARAIANRNKGYHTGASAKGWNVKRPMGDENDFATHVALALNTWRLDKADALNDYRAIMLNGGELDNEIPW